MQAYVPRSVYNFGAVFQSTHEGRRTKLGNMRAWCPAFVADAEWQPNAAWLWNEFTSQIVIALTAVYIHVVNVQSQRVLVKYTHCCSILTIHCTHAHTHTHTHTHTQTHIRTYTRHKRTLLLRKLVHSHMVHEGCIFGCGSSFVLQYNAQTPPLQSDPAAPGLQPHNSWATHTWLWQQLCASV